MKEFTLTKNEADLRLDKYIHKVLKNAGTGFIYKMLRKKNITLNGKKADGTEKTKEGDVVRFFFSDETFGKMSGAENVLSEYDRLMGLSFEKKIHVLFEDDDVCFLDKASGELSQTDDSGKDSLNEYFLSYLINTGKLSRDEFKTFKPSVSNRLDRNTSGILICGKTLKGLQENAAMLRDRNCEKHYRALVVGDVKEKKKVSAYLLKNESDNRATVFSEYHEGASLIETEYSPAERFGEYTLLDVHLITGKTHQIRAHLSSLKHPVVGDPKYGDKKVNTFFEKEAKVKYQLLHSYEFISENYHVLAPLPAYFEKALLLCGKE